MGAMWLLSLPDVLRAAGLEVDTWPGWELRARSSGGYDAVLAVQVHHTASKTTPANDMTYMWENADSEPIGALYLARDGRYTVGAAGATNTSGQGGPLGAIPLDAANRYVISIEAANDGVGEPWPAVQIDAYQRGVAALCPAYGLSLGWPDVHSHREWTGEPPRKIDPAGPSPWATGSSSWDMDAFRADLLGTSPPPIGDLMYTIIHVTDKGCALGGLMDAKGIAPVVEWLSPARYAALENLRPSHVNLTAADMINCTLLGAIPDGMTAGNFANVVT